MAQLPTKADILAWIAENPSRSTKRDIAKAFAIKGASRVDLKRMLTELAQEGQIEKFKRNYRDPDLLPPVSVLEVLEPSADGDLYARALEWKGQGGDPSIMIVLKKTDPALGQGDRILARVTQVGPETSHYSARLIRKIGGNAARSLGIFRKTAEGGRIIPIDKKNDKEWIIPEAAIHGACDGELVEAELTPGAKTRMGLARGRVITRLGDPSKPGAVSLIAIHQHGIPHDFPEDVIAAADMQVDFDIKGREDLTHLPFVTIDPSDARDHDDACFASVDQDPKNPGGMRLWVGIADVAEYVIPKSVLDTEALNRGNSSYFPDRVVPMLPDRLSGDLCSLHENVTRPVIAVEMVLNDQGQKISHRFTRAFMRSVASLSYEEAQTACEGNPSERAAKLLDDVIRPLFAAYNLLKAAREVRQPLELDLPERKISLDQEGTVTSVSFRKRLDAHRLIEEFMVLANVAAAETLIDKKTPLLFRVHEEPSPEKLDALRTVAETAGYRLPKGQVLQTRHINTLLDQASGSDDAELINLTALRSMTQAYYSPKNRGHFGLALANYAHFTSPIRRYSDLIVHRALISAHSWGQDGLSLVDRERLDQTAQHISQTERRSMLAERDTTDRYLAAYLSEKVGLELPGRISGIARFGVFVKLDETGADGLVPIRSLGGEYFRFDRENNTLMGSESGLMIGLGQRAVVRVKEAALITGGLEFELIELDEQELTQGSGHRRGSGRKMNSRKGRRKKEAKARKVTRQRR